jgi:g-D-glutamyl-meso-diaminopimelate peptidase
MATFTPYTPYPTRVVTATVQPYTDGVQPAVIGTSVAGRPIEVIRFGSGPSGRMMVADIHGGNEWNTTALMDQLIEYIKAKPEVIPDGVSLYILRTLNPDGLARALNPDGRVNDNGVDLNRNWDASWVETWDRDGCWSLRPTTGGPYPNSEPETQALIQFVLSNPMDALISYHSAALGIFPAGMPPDPQSVRLAESIAAVTDYAYPPINTGCVYTGGLVDWMALQGIPSVDLELTTHLSTDFEENKNVLDALVHFQKE